MPGPIVASAIRTAATAIATDALTKEDKKPNTETGTKNYMDLSSLRGAKERNSHTNVQDDTEVNVSVEPTESITSTQDVPRNDPETFVVDSSEPIDDTSEQTSVLKEISSKISTLTNMIAKKFVGSPVLDMPEPTTESVIKEQIDEKNKPETDPTKVLDPEPNTDKTSNDKPESKPSPAIGVLKKGFGALQKTGDAIANLLFKQTITGALEAAKLGAMVFSIILALDLIRIHFSYWIEQLLAWWERFKNDWFTNWQSYFSEWGKWGTILDTISTSIGRILNAIRDGDFPALVGAIIKGLIETGQAISETIRLAIFKGIGSVLRHFGFDNAAETVEGYALERYSRNANGNLTEQEQQKLAKYQAEKNSEGPTWIDNVVKYSPFGMFRTVGDFITDTVKGTRDVQSAYTKSLSSIKGLPKAEQEQIITAMNQARKATIDYGRHTESVNLGNSADVQRLQRSYKETQNIISDKRLDAVPELRKELQRHITEANKDMEKRRPKPQSPTGSKDANTAKRIIKADQKMTNSNSSNNNVNATVNNTKVVQNRQIVQMNPVTGSRAPGIFGATGVN